MTTILDQVEYVVSRAKSMLGEARSLVVNEKYWKMFTVIAYYYISDNYEVVELYSKDGLLLRIRKDEDGVEWRISHLAECTCSE